MHRTLLLLSLSAAATHQDDHHPGTGVFTDLAPSR